MRLLSIAILANGFYFRMIYKSIAHRTACWIFMNDCIICIFQRESYSLVQCLKNSPPLKGWDFLTWSKINIKCKYVMIFSFENFEFHLLNWYYTFDTAIRFTVLFQRKHMPMENDINLECQRATSTWSGKD